MSLKRIIYAFILFTSVVAVSCSEKDNAEIGNEFYNSAEYEKAIEAYSEHLTMKPSDEIIIYNRGRAYEELGKYDEALEDFEKVVKINPKSESALMSLGKHYFRLKEYENAAFQFEKAYKVNTSSSQAALLLARALHKAGQVEKAMEYYDIAINNDSKNGEAFMYRGALKLFLNQSTGGCSDIQKARNMGIEEAEDLYKKYCN